MNRDLLLPYRDSADGPICEYAFKIRKKKKFRSAMFQSPNADCCTVQYIHGDPEPVCLPFTQSIRSNRIHGTPVVRRDQDLFFCRTKISKSLMFYFFVKKVY